MPSVLDTIEVIVDGQHVFQVLAPDKLVDWLQDLAEEYLRLRTACATPLNDISLDGIEVVNVRKLQQRLMKASIPRRRLGNFDVVRSDFGELICAMVLEKAHGTQFGYRSLRDRETVQLPGRGIDIIGIEDGDRVTLVLGEAKVSDEDASPPQVVDTGDDCLSKQHKGHIKERLLTANKIWDLSRRVHDRDVRDLFLKAALYFEGQRWDKVKLVTCCTMVRPANLYRQTDFGSFRKRPTDFQPAEIRFTVVSVPDRVEATIQQWYEAIVKMDEMP